MSKGSTTGQWNHGHVQNLPTSCCSGLGHRENSTFFKFKLGWTTFRKPPNHLHLKKETSLPINKSRIHPRHPQDRKGRAPRSLRLVRAERIENSAVWVHRLKLSGFPTIILPCCTLPDLYSYIFITMMTVIHFFCLLLTPPPVFFYSYCQRCCCY